MSVPALTRPGAIPMRWLAIAGLSLAVAAAPTLAEEIEREVTTTADQGEGSLRALLEEAAGSGQPYRITFGERDGLFSTPREIRLQSPLPAVTGKVTIDGRIPRLLWRAYGVTVSGAGEHRILEVAPNATLYLNGITLADGFADNGGAILNRGTLIVEGVTLIGNQATDDGGAIASVDGRAWFINSTATGNSAGRGGALAALGGELTVTHATLYDNRADQASALYSSSDLSLANSILYGDHGVQCVHAGGLEREIQNLINTHEGCGEPALDSDPRLGQMGYYNGPTPTIPIGGDSPALNIADGEAALDHLGNRLVWDQRGNGDPRFAGGFADLGAFERQSQLPDEYRVDTLDDQGQRGCTLVGMGNCPLRAAVELALAGRDPAPIRFSRQVFDRPRQLVLDPVPEATERELLFDGEDAVELTILIAAPPRAWHGRNGVTLEFTGSASASAANVPNVPNVTVERSHAP